MKVLLGCLMVAVSFCANAVDGHNGIRFSMSQKDLETKGFVCRPPERESTAIAVCRHMEMTGTAFGFPTQNYQVSIGANKRVADIRADVGGVRNVPDYIGLLAKVQEFFPQKDEVLSQSAQGVFIRDVFRASDKSGATVFFSSGVKGLTRSTLWLTFTSPAEMAAVDKLVAERERKGSKGKAAAEPSDSASDVEATTK